jgi:hypothetical protein
MEYWSTGAMAKDGFFSILQYSGTPVLQRLTIARLEDYRKRWIYLFKK